MSLQINENTYHHIRNRSVYFSVFVKLRELPRKLYHICYELPRIYHVRYTRFRAYEITGIITEVIAFLLRISTNVPREIYPVSCLWNYGNYYGNDQIVITTCHGSSADSHLVSGLWNYGQNHGRCAIFITKFSESQTDWFFGGSFLFARNICIIV